MVKCKDSDLSGNMPILNLFFNAQSLVNSCFYPSILAADSEEVHAQAPRL